MNVVFVVNVRDTTKKNFTYFADHIVQKEFCGFCGLITTKKARIYNPCLCFVKNEMKVIFYRIKGIVILLIFPLYLAKKVEAAKKLHRVSDVQPNF